MGSGSGRASGELAAWEERGKYRTLRWREIFTVDIAAGDSERNDPLLILHGFPTCSFDFHLVVERLSRHRRVLLLDMLGFGLSEKPDLRYSIETQADIVEACVSEVFSSRVTDASTAGMSPVRIALLTHDMGDTVGGELLARQAEGCWPVEISQRVVTNGSIYLDMAHLTDGQNFLLSLPDEVLPSSLDPSGGSMMNALEATFSSSSAVAHAELEAAWELIEHNGGDRMLPRLIRYIEDRRSKENRYTGAIESHSSPLAVVWGTEDPIAVVDMAKKLHATRPDASLTLLDGLGHYPMLESPDSFAEAVEQALAS